MNDIVEMPSPKPEPPECAMHVWEWFWELSQQRKHAHGTVEPITSSLVRDWSQMTGNCVTRPEFQFLMQMDAKYREAWALEAERYEALANRDQQWTLQ